MNWTRSGALMLGLFLVAGCTTGQPIRGYVSESEAQGEAVNFAFYDQAGKEHQLSELAYGSVMVLAVVDESAGQQVNLARDLDLLAQKRANDGVVAVFVSEAKVGADPEKVCVTDTEYRPQRLTMLCDGTGRVKSGYGVTGKNGYVVIDHKGRIAGRSDDLAGLTPSLEKAITRFQEASAGWPRASSVY